MPELTVRAIVHHGALGHTGDLKAPALLAADLDTRPIASLVA